MLIKKTYDEICNMFKLDRLFLPQNKMILKFTDQEDTSIICSLCKGHKKILEIGTQWGHTTQNIATFNPEADITTVDITSDMGLDLKFQNHEILSEEESGIMITAKNVTQLKMTSDDFFRQNKECFDAIFIDGDHSYEQVKKDTTNAITCLNPEGIIIWHDVYNKDNSCSKCRCEPEFNDVRELLEKVEFKTYKVGMSWVAVYQKGFR